MTTPTPAPTTQRSGLRRTLGRLRVRVVVVYVLLLAIALGLSALATRQILLTRLDREIDAALTQEVEELEQLAGGVDPETGEPFGGDAAAIFDTYLRRNVPSDGEAFFTLVDGDPAASSAGAPVSLLDDGALVERWAAVREPERSTVDTEAGEARVLAAPLLDGDDVVGTFVVAYFPAGDRDEIFTAIRTILIIGLVVLALASVAAWTAAGRVLRPVRTLTETAQRITDEDLTARIPVDGNDELAELGATFNAMVDRLEVAFRSQRELLDDVAHELRTPITIVRGHLEVLGDDPAERAETVALLTDELDRMGRSITDLLLLAKAETPDFLHRGPTDLGHLVEGAHERARALGDREWVLDPSPAPGGVILTADTDRLMQALVNLADNAVDQTAPGDTIALGGGVVDGAAHLWVRDTGPGVAPEDRDRIFRRFGRAAPGRSGAEGAGLGLSIVAAIARAHGGRAWLDADYGEGARFVVSIPLGLAGDHDEEDER